MGFPGQVKPVVGFEKVDNLKRVGIEVTQCKNSLTSIDLYGKHSTDDILLNWKV